MKKERFLLLMLFFCFTFLSVGAQNKGGITMSFKNESLPSALRRLQKASDYKIMFTYDDVEGFRVTGSVKNEAFQGVLQMLLSGKPLDYSIDGQLVNITLREHPQTYEDAQRELRGTVVAADNGEAVIGATIRIMGTQQATVTDVEGHFSFSNFPRGARLIVSYVGMQTVNVKAEDGMKIRLKSDSKQVDEVVVNGSFTRKANTFTGAVTTVKGEDLQKVGNANVLQSLKNIDPSFMQIENLSAGSNPNALPDFQMRGSSTISSVQGEYASSANQPLFILDGFETELTKILDLDMNQVESVTTLKDATAKAIYGSKAANGVIVIETKKPEQGRMRITYTGSLDVEVPDLSSYNLCNASEKLQVEKLAGLFSSDNAVSQIALDKTYSNKLREVLMGVNTDWLAQPVRTGVGEKHSLYLDGGQQSFQYGVSLAYNDIAGAMKGSDRRTFSGGIMLAYRLKNLLFRNKLTIDYNNSDNSPYGSFDTYYKMNPYSRIYDENGNMNKTYYYTNNSGESGTYYNPLYNTTLNTIDNTTYTNITDNFYIEWQISQAFRMTGRFGIVHKTSTADKFKPANHTDFISMTDEFRKGSYYQENGKTTDVSADLGLSYSKQIDKHLIFTNAQLSMTDNQYSTVGVTAEGFPNDFMDDITFAVQYAKNSKPTGIEGISRSCGGLLSVNYSYDERYLFDANYRLTGSSEAGSQNRWGSFWSLGGGWNMHNEKFIKNLKVIDRLKLRASFGYTGSQGFSSYDAMPTFVYYSGSSYNGSIGSYVKGLANEYLKWQQKYDTNIGVDINMFKNRLSGRFDYYIADTKGMITDVTVPYTTGFTTYVANLGETENKGWEAYLNYRIIDKGRDYLNVFANVSHNKNKLKKISESLRAWNEAQDKNMTTNKTITPSVKYYEGCSMTSIWAVKSLGIDPQNGKEILMKRDGTVTYDYDTADQVVCGDTQPKYNGNFGFNGELNGWGFNVTANYRWGGQIYNSTLVERVENAQLQYNVDKRVLSDRWQKAGDMALYKAITDQSVTYPTSRFVQDYNLFTMASLTLYYDFRNCNFVKNSFIERLKVSAYTNDLFVISSVKTERGTSYPFARTFSLSAQITF
jgi:TonB-linked SusC/RagA family outer membrane protein